MRWMIATVAFVLGSSAALGATITTTHFSSYADAHLELAFDPPFDFDARGTTEWLRVMTADGATAELDLPKTPNPWHNGEPHAFRVAYDATTQLASLIVDTFFVSHTVGGLRAETGALLITAFTDVPTATVRLENLQLLSGQNVYALNTTAIADGGASSFDIVLMNSDLPLSQSWQLGGTVTFSWTGDLPLDTRQWFEVSPVVTIPEPATAVLLVAASALCWPRRRA